MANRTMRLRLEGEDVSASKAMAGVEKAGHHIAEKVGGAFSKMGDMIGGEVGDLVSKVGDGFSDMGEKGASMGTKLTGAGTAVLGLGVAMQSMADKKQAADNQLKAAIESSHHSYAAYKDQIDETIESQEKFGHTEGDTEGALYKLTAATQSPKLALKDMGLVANLAAAQHETLTQAASQLARVYGGSGKVLKQYGITMTSIKQAVSFASQADKKHEKAMADLSKAQQKLSDLTRIDAGVKHLSIGQTIALEHAHKALKDAQNNVVVTTYNNKFAQEQLAKAQHATGDALSQLSQRLSGQAAAASDTFMGRMRALKSHVEDVGSAIALKVGPVLTKLGPIMMGVGQIINSGLIPKLGNAVVWIAKFGWSMVVMAAKSLAAMGAMIIRGAVWAASMAADAAIAMAPFLPIIAIVAAVAFAAYELYKHWDTVWKFIKRISLDVWHWMVDIFHNKVFGIILGIVSPLLWVATHWKTTWNVIKSLSIGVWHFLKDVFHGIVTAVETLAAPVVWVANHWRDIFRGMYDGVVDVWHWAVDLFHNKITQTVMSIVAPLLWVATHWRTVWGTIKSIGLGAYHFIANNVVHPIASVFHAIGQSFENTARWIGRTINTVERWFGDLGNNITNIASGMWNGFENAARSAFDWVANIWNDSVGSLSFTIPSWVPGVGGDGFSMPKIPLMAAGGIVTKPTLAVIGEAGPEAVVPLSGGRPGLGGGGDTINIHIGTILGDPKAAARIILAELQRMKGQGTNVALG